MRCLDLYPDVLALMDKLEHPEHYFVSAKWVKAWENVNESKFARLRVLSSPDELLFVPPLDDEIKIHLGHTLCRVIILTGAARTGKTEWLEKRLPFHLRDRPHAYIDLPSDMPQQPCRERLQWLYAEIDSRLGTKDAIKAGHAIISVDEPLRLLHGLHSDSDLAMMANGLFQPFDNGLQQNQRPSHLFIADTNHFALPVLLAAQAREGNEARFNAVLMQTHKRPHGGTFPSPQVDYFHFNARLCLSVCR